MYPGEHNRQPCGGDPLPSPAFYINRDSGTPPGSFTDSDTGPYPDCPSGGTGF
jgi:hypothetical protein